MEQRPAAHAFSAVDQTGDSAALVRHLDALGGLDFMQVLERRIATLLHVGAGGCFLDVGCGTGDDVRSLARLVGPSGRVVGIDSSARIIAEAQQRAGATELRVAFCLGDAHQLAFGDERFDGTRVRRVLQHVENPRQVVAELTRVTRRGGYVVAFEPDWGTLFVDAADQLTTRRIVELRCDRIRNGWIGRQLPRLLQDAGLVEVTAEPLAFTETNYTRGLSCPGLELATYAEQARVAGVISAQAAAAWLAELEERGRAGGFFAGFIGVLVSGRRP